jgi:hypothetical protein
MHLNSNAWHLDRFKGFYEDPKEEDSMFTLNMGTFQPNYTAFPPRT